MSAVSGFPNMIGLQALLGPLLPYAGWGIGGSCLLWSKGWLDGFRDLDLVCCESMYPTLTQALEQAGWQPLAVEPHPQYQSRCFSRWYKPDLPVIELMAGVRGQHAAGSWHWQFAPHRISYCQQLPWMQVSDWLTLYQLFDRPERVALIRSKLMPNRELTF